MGKHLCNQKKVGLLPIEFISEKFQNLGKSLKDGDDVFDLVVRKTKKAISDASGRIEKIYLAYQNPSQTQECCIF